MRASCLRIVGTLFALACGWDGTVIAAENVGRVQQPIRAGTLVDTATQQARGLVTVAGGCSGTLLNRHWVLTADHCLSADGSLGGITAALSDRRITAAWSPNSIIPTRVVRNWWERGLDVALIFLGNGDFGDAPAQLISFRPLEVAPAGQPQMSVRKFGRGNSSYASAGPPPTPATNDGQYRSADFQVSAVGTTTYTLDANAAGQVGHGGDSGGPDWTIGPSGGVVSIAGVQSTCLATYVMGQPQTWTWASGIQSCNSAPLWNIYSELVEITRPEHVTFCQDYAARAMAAVNANQSLRCGNSGGSWHADAGLHLSWCMGFNGNRDQPNRETALRTNAIDQCRSGSVFQTLEDARRSPSGGLLSDAARVGSGAGLNPQTEVRLPNTPGVGTVQSPATMIPSPNPGPGVNFAGEWDTVTGANQYRMTLAQDGSGRVFGEYHEPGSSDRFQVTNGAVVGNELIAQWSEGSSTGLFRMQLAPDGQSFSGSWAGGASMPDQSSNIWSGTRIATMAAPGTTAELPAPQTAPIGGVCGPPGGTAIVSIADPQLTRLNVRDEPGGRVLTTVAEGTEVSIVGVCGPAGSAGIVAPSASDGWCQIDAPAAGCVAARFLDFSGSPAAGIVAEQQTIVRPPSAEIPAQAPVLVPNPAQQGEPLKARVRSAANVRASPNGTIIGKLQAGTELLIAGCSGAWCRILIDGGIESWVHSSLLDMTGSDAIIVAPASPAVPPVGTGAPVASGCGLPMGAATVLIPEPNLSTLNVREAPGGRVLGTIPEGTRVQVIGECGATHAAGIVALPTPAPTPGWCQIDQPMIGCVASRYLAPDLAGSPPPAAGVVAAPSVAPTRMEATFEGSWETSVFGLAHTLTLTQAGDNVIGTYSGADGSTGQIGGMVTNGILRFSWQQVDGQTGSGMFSLSSDGQRLEGTISLSSDPNQVDGPWTGFRR